MSAPLWDAKAAYEIGAFVRSFLELHPPPTDSPLASDLRELEATWASQGAEWAARFQAPRDPAMPSLWDAEGHTAAAIMVELFDLLARRLPSVPLDDPGRTELFGCLFEFGRRLGSAGAGEA